MVSYICNPTIWRPRVENCQPGLHCESLSQPRKKKRRRGEKGQIGMKVQANDPSTLESETEDSETPGQPGHPVSRGGGGKQYLR